MPNYLEATTPIESDKSSLYWSEIMHIINLNAEGFSHLDHPVDSFMDCRDALIALREGNLSKTNDHLSTARDRERNQDFHTRCHYIIMRIIAILKNDDLSSTKDIVPQEEQEL
jgi:hypothetical protein